jgi:hypothetical protein
MCLPQHCHPERREGSAVAFEIANVTLLPSRRQSNPDSPPAPSPHTHCTVILNAEKDPRLPLRFSTWRYFQVGDNPNTTLLRHHLPHSLHCHPERREGSAVAVEIFNMALLPSRRQSKHDSPPTPPTLPTPSTVILNAVKDPRLLFGVQRGDTSE